MEKKTTITIDQILERIKAHPEYSACVAQSMMGMLREEADHHSSSIELAAKEQLNEKTIEMLRRQSYIRLASARNFIHANGVTLYSISCLGNILEPKENPRRNFRQNTRVLFGEGEGANPEEIIYKVGDLVERLNDAALHPIKRAIDSHISLVQIHPYGDGNGRAARLVQDICLETKNYPPGIIPVSDRGLYIHLMNLVLRDRKTSKSSVYDPSDSEVLFQDFIESKVLASAQKLESELQEKRVYEVRFPRVRSPSVALKIKHLLIGNHGRLLTVRLEKDKQVQGVEYIVMGNIDLTEISQRVARIGIKYREKCYCDIKETQDP